MIEKIVNYLEEVVAEMKKVVWPSKDDLVNSTVVVIILSLVFSFFIWVVDQAFSKIVGFLISG